MRSPSNAIVYPTGSKGLRALIPLALALLVPVLIVGCGEQEPVAVQPEEPLAGTESLERAACEFAVYWPPKDPEEDSPVEAKPLLRGVLKVDTKQADAGGAELRLGVTVRRPAEEADREFWNSRLAYADIAWMSAVRVWDVDKKWLWPNLPYLLRLPGEERIERYGGIDPGKQVDNDFAAVLIRKFDARGEVESPDTKHAPLVSAEWHAEDKGSAEIDGRSVVHVAKSDTFLLHLGGKGEPARGRLKVWLIYADFLGSRPPATWPRAREWAGGILAYFEIDWETSPDGSCRGLVRNRRPESSTGFKWSDWVTRTPDSDESKAAFRLSDVGEHAGP